MKIPKLVIQHFSENPFSGVLRCVPVPLIHGISLVFGDPQDDLDPSWVFFFSPKTDFSLSPLSLSATCRAHALAARSALWPSAVPHCWLSVQSPSEAGHERAAPAICAAVHGPFHRLHESQHLLQDTHFPLQPFAVFQHCVVHYLQQQTIRGRIHEQRLDFTCWVDPARRLWEWGRICISGQIFSKYLILWWLLPS